MKSAISSGERLSPQPSMSPDLIYEHEQSNGNSKSTKTAVAELKEQRLSSGLQVVHTTPGRLRLRTTDSSLNSILDTISQQLRQQDGIGEVRANQETGSLVIRFDEKKRSKQQILGVLQQFGVSEPQASLPEEKETDPFAAWKSVEFWKEQGISFIPLIAGLFVTGRLGIHGLPAIPVYLITAGATRRVIEMKSNGKSPAVDETSDLAPQSSKIAYSVVHAIPGRLRFHVPRLAQDQAYAQQLQMLLKADTQTTSFRVNRARASLVITYDPGLIPDAEMRERSVSERVSHWVGLIQKAGVASPPEGIAQTKPTTATEQPTPEPASAWVDLKPPALAASLEFMANLPVQAVPD